MTARATFLPSKGHKKARRAAFFILSLAPFLFGALALYLGQDANWDLRNYHWYNAYAFLNGRFGFDLLPSQVPSFYNPALDVPFFLLGSHVSAKMTAFVLGTVQGLNFVLLFMLAHAALIVPNARQKVWVCAGLAALGMLGGGGIAQLGATFYDNVTSLGLFASALMVLRFWPLFLKEAPARALGLAFLSGVPAGLMMGLKLPSALFCVGLCGAILFVTGPWRRRVWISFGFGLGVLAAAVVSLGPWAFFLYSEYGNPFFPYFDKLFPSAFSPPGSIRDIKFIPQTWHDRLLFPFIFAEFPQRVGEIPWRDLRLPLLYVLLPAAAFLRLVYGRNKRAADRFADFSTTRYLLWFAVLSYVVWLFAFAIYRYVLPLEMLAPLLIVLTIGLLPLRAGPRAMLAGFALLAVALTVQPGDWGRRETWLDRTVEVSVPDLKDPQSLMILMAGYEPYSHVVPSFPPEIPFVRIQSNFINPEVPCGFNDLIRRRVAEHRGAYKILIPRYQFELAQKALRLFDLAFLPQKCQIVEDHLYPSNLALCDVKRTKDKP